MQTVRVAHGASVTEDTADGAGGQWNELADLPVGKIILLVQDDDEHDLLVRAEAVEPGILPADTAGGDGEPGDGDCVTAAGARLPHVPLEKCSEFIPGGAAGCRVRVRCSGCVCASGGAGTR